jgi:hypothetical protein
MNQENLEKLQNTYSEVEDTIYRLLLDLKVCSGELAKDDENQFWRRTFIRTLFATIEGINYQFKRLALCVADCSALKLDTATETLLKEESYELKNNGQVKTSKAKLRTADNLLFSWNIVGVVCEVTNKVDQSGDDWQNFIESIKIRDRITHPKHLEDLNISDSNSETIFRTYFWFESNITTALQLLDKAKDKLESKF